MPCLLRSRLHVPAGHHHQHTHHCQAALWPVPLLLVVQQRRQQVVPEQQQRLRQRYWQQAVGGSTTETAEPAGLEGSDGDEDPEQQLAALPRPSQHHQPQLSGKERAALRSQAEQLAKAKTLQRVQVGGKGITLNVLITIMDVLLKYEFVRVKLGEGCGLERKQTAAELAQLLDAAVVGQVGFTITLYRQKGLPRPDSLAKPAGQQQEM